MSLNKLTKKDDWIVDIYLNFLFQTLAVFWMSYVFFWVIPQRLNFICRRFGTLRLFHLRRRPWRWNRRSVPKRRHIKFRRRGITQKKTWNIYSNVRLTHNSIYTIHVNADRITEIANSRTKFFEFWDYHSLRTVKPTRCTNVWKFILCVWNDSTRFGWSFGPSPEVHDCTYGNRHMTDRYCCLFASGLVAPTQN